MSMRTWFPLRMFYLSGEVPSTSPHHAVCNPGPGTLVAQEWPAIARRRDIRNLRPPRNLHSRPPLLRCVVSLPECAHGAGLSYRAVGGDEGQVVHARCGDDQAIR